MGSCEAQAVRRLDTPVVAGGEERGVVVVPTYNEAANIETLFNEIRSALEPCCGFELVFVDDGSTDRTVQVAREQGVHHIVEHKVNRGLAAAYQSGMNACIGECQDHSEQCFCDVLCFHWSVTSCWFGLCAAFG